MNLIAKNYTFVSLITIKTMWWAKVMSLLAITVLITWLIIRTDSWFKKNKQSHGRGILAA